MPFIGQRIDLKLTGIYFLSTEEHEEIWNAVQLKDGEVILCWSSEERINIDDERYEPGGDDPFVEEEIEYLALVNLLSDKEYSPATDAGNDGWDIIHAGSWVNQSLAL